MLLARWTAAAQQLPSQHFGVADGLAHSLVGAIYHDRQGYLWFGTAEGLSRFDGYTFRNYGTAEGLPSAVVTSMAENRFDRLWVGTLGGLARLVEEPRDPAATSRGRRGATDPTFVRFSVGQPPAVVAIVTDAAGQLWFVADGLYRADFAEPLSQPAFERVVPFPTYMAATVFADSRRRVWTSCDAQLLVVSDGRTSEYTVTAGAIHRTDGAKRPVTTDALDRITAVTEDRRGSVYVATGRDVFEFPAGAALGEDRRWRRLPVLLSPVEAIRAISTDVQGGLWIGTTQGLARFTDDRPPSPDRWLQDRSVRALRLDRDGNLWVGSQNAGVSKLSRGPIVSYTRAQGLPDVVVTRVLEGIDGRIYASTATGGLVAVEEDWVVPIDGSQAPPFHNVDTRILRDSRGDWWVHTDEALYRFAGPALQLRDGRRFTAADGLPVQGPHSGPGLHEDRSGRIWVSSGEQDLALYVFDPHRVEGPLFRRVPVDPAVLDGYLRMIADPQGVLWVSSYGQLARLSPDGLRPVRRSDGLPDTRVRSLFLDHRGWLWAGLRSGGVSFTKNPAAAEPDFENFSLPQGLSSDAVWGITEDAHGQIYLGTGRGLDRLDPATGRLRKFTVGDGLVGSACNHLITDRRGNVWIATSDGLSKLSPRVTPDAAQPPTIHLSHIQVSGENLALPPRGAGHVRHAPMYPDDHVSISYVALSTTGPQGLRYRYKLEGASGDWNGWTTDRAVTYARVGSGSYRFIVEAMDVEGRTSPHPAVFEFDVLPPMWRRGWFLTLAGGVSLLLALGAYRLRERQIRREFALLLGERNRLAREVHDTLAQGLVGISMQLESVRETLAADPSDAARHLDRARELTRAGLADARRSVRELRPHALEHQTLACALEDLARLMTSTSTSVHVMTRGATRPLPFDVEDAVFRIAQEAVTNAVRHARPRRVDIALHFERQGARLVVEDDGCGIQAEALERSAGLGLTGMRERAARIGGDLSVTPGPSAGTRVELRVARRPSSFLRDALLRLTSRAPRRDSGPQP